ncbi:MAG: hypothetical protein K0R65_1287 [Crocinitomicaceae bacterium]|jgi:hypothetical protein|nr:hypothetical protein [Crocinitomicaceae bacterium]
MKKALILLSLLAIVFTVDAQYKPKKKRKDFFGTEKLNNRQIGNWGMHLGAGPSFSLASDNKSQVEENLSDGTGNFYTYEIDQKGKTSGNVSLGINYYSKKAGWFSFGRIIDYYELGAGFNYYRGIEQTTMSDAANRDIPDITGEGDYFAGLVSGRFSIHKILPITNTKMFLDNGLGVHAEYNILKADAAYSNFISTYAKYSPDFTTQINYSLGLGFQLKRGSYLVPSVFVPVFSVQELGKQAVYWFDSKYYPINVQIRWLYRFSRAKGKTNCTTPDKSPIPAPEGSK